MLTALLAFTLPSAAEEEEEKEGQQEVATISYYQIKPSLVANLASGGRYIRCDIQLMTKDDTFLEALKLHDPAIRHTLLLLLSEQDGKAIKKPEGKEALRKKALSQVNALMKEQTGKEGLSALFFTTFFVQ
ncbi:MAG: flagellar basal body-associated FliL family protein [Candidatus Thiodiazotropha sp. (ex Monitilora ramsayi)]|nr:flagellar basal body-associated FliL family protein [Candidatus Thiodiazotropha sp. (ex Monitilora ramsayi)]